MRIVWYRGKWAATWHDPTGTRRVSLRTADRATAERQLEELKKQLAERSGTTVDGVLDLYLEEKADRPSHKVLTYQSKWPRKLLGEMPPGKITRQVCRRYVEQRRGHKHQGRPTKESTILKELSLVRSAVRFVAPNCGAVFELPSTPPPRDRHLTRTEYEKLRLAAETSFHTWLFIVLALNTGARSAALLELTWDRIDFERGLIALSTAEQVRRKGRATVPMNAAVRAALEMAAKVRVTRHVVEFGGEPIKSIKKSFLAAVKRAELEDVSPHILRHTAAVWMAEKDIPMVQIAQFLGHKNSRTTEMVYARFSPSFLRGAADALE